MKFFYKGKPIDRDNNELQSLLDTGSEIVSIMFDKVKGMGNTYKIFRHDYQTEEKVNKFDFFIAEMDWNNNQSIKSIFNPLFSQKFYFNFNKPKGIFTEVDINIVLPFIKQDNLRKAKNLLDNFFVQKLETTVKDKNNDIYDLKIFENTDNNLGVDLYLSSVYLFKNKKMVAYLNAAYTTPELSIKYEDREKTPNMINVARIDYSKVKLQNEKELGYNQKGLGYLMYFNMAQFLNEKGIELRQSLICSPSATRVWNKMSEYWPQQIFEKKIKNGKKKESVHFLSIGSNLKMSFEPIDKKPIINIKNTNESTLSLLGKKSNKL